MRFLILVSTALMFVGCTRVNHAIDAANAIPAKLDNTNNQVGKTNEQVTKTNQEVTKTNEFVREEGVRFAFEDLLNPQLGQDLTPVPFDLMPFAEKFGEFSTPDELVQVVYLWMKKLNELTISVDSPTPIDIAAFNHHKLQTYLALQAVCGMLTDDKVQQIIDNEIKGEGRFEESALQLLMLRVQFIRDILLNASLLEEPLDNVGKVEKAVAYAESIEKVARLPYSKKISVKITGFMNPYPTLEETLDTSVALSTWKSIQSKAKLSLTVSAEDLTGDPATNQKLLQDRQARSDKALATVQDRINGWSVRTP